MSVAGHDYTGITGGFPGEAAALPHNFAPKWLRLPRRRAQLPAGHPALCPRSRQVCGSANIPLALARPGYVGPDCWVEIHPRLSPRPRGESGRGNLVAFFGCQAPPFPCPPAITAAISNIYERSPSRTAYLRLAVVPLLLSRSCERNGDKRWRVWP